MAKFLSKGFWEFIASIILRSRLFILLLIVGITIFLSFQWKHMRFSHSEANLLPDDHEVNLEYNAFLEQFGDEGNLVILAIQSDSLFTPRVLNAWNQFSNKIAQSPAVSLTLSLEDLKILEKMEDPPRFDLNPFISDSIVTTQNAIDYRNKLFNDLPFYEDLIYNKETGTVRSAIYIDKEIIDTQIRKDFILKELVPAIEAFEKKHDLIVRTSGMPYIRTLNSQNIVDEIGFTLLLFL